ncbi:MAG TPA: hypothetical protein EYP23_06020 [Thermoplasmata archaeon]|nr:hypothetical protein [Thermoplasmata archaeon]
METVPLIYVRNECVLDNKTGEETKNWEPLIERLKQLYVIDVDGLLENKPCLELYQRMCEYVSLWVDSGPRVFEDVMDIVVAGAEKITVQRKLFKDDSSQLFDAMEREIYSGLELQDVVNGLWNEDSKWTGVVVYVHTEIGFKEKDYLGTVAKKTPLYLVAREQGFIDREWGEDVGVKGIIYPVGEE